MVADPERNEILSGLLCRLAGDDQGAKAIDLAERLGEQLGPHAEKRLQDYR